MIRSLPTGRQGRMLALGLALATIVATYVAVAAPLVELYADRAALIETRHSLLIKLRSVAAGLPALRTRVTNLRAESDTSKVTLDGSTDAIASAALQGRIEGLAGAAGVTIGSTEGLPVEVRGPYRRIGLRLVLSGSYESLVTLLARLEAAVPPTIVDNMQFHAFQKRPGARSSTPPLDASFEVYGFRADAESADAKTSGVVPR